MGNNLTNRFARWPHKAITLQRFVDEVLPQLESVTDDYTLDFFCQLVSDFGLTLHYVPQTDADALAVPKEEFHLAIEKSYRKRDVGYQNTLAESGRLSLPDTAWDVVIENSISSVKQNPLISDLFVYRDHVFTIIREMQFCDPLPWVGKSVKVVVPENPTEAGGLVFKILQGQQPHACELAFA